MAKVIDANKGEDVTKDVKYTDNIAFLGQAFSLYLNGMSLVKVSAALKPEWPDCTARAVQRLARENGWEDARNSYVMARQQAIATAEGLMPKIVLQMEKLRMKMEARPLSAADVFAYRAVCEDLLLYTGQHPKFKGEGSLVISTDKEVQALLKAIQEDEVVGAAFRKRKKEIQKKYEQNMKAGSGK